MDFLKIRQDLKKSSETEEVQDEITRILVTIERDYFNAIRQMGVSDKARYIEEIQEKFLKIRGKYGRNSNIADEVIENIENRLDEKGKIGEETVTATSSILGVRKKPSFATSYQEKVEEEVYGVIANANQCILHTYDAAGVLSLEKLEQLQMELNALTRLSENTEEMEEIIKAYQSKIEEEIQKGTQIEGREEEENEFLKKIKLEKPIDERAVIKRIEDSALSTEGIFEETKKKESYVKEGDLDCHDIF